MTNPDAISIQSLVLTRNKAPGSFATDTLLRASLAVIDLDCLTPATCSNMVASLLNETEITRISKFTHAKRQQSFTFGRLAAKLALSHHCPGHNPRQAQVDNGVFDQPVITSARTAFNDLGVSITHSGHYAAALVFHRAHPMGIDIDLPTTDDANLILADLKPAITKMLAGLHLGVQARAGLIWVARESIGKTLTTGMMTPLAIYAPSSIEIQDGIFVVQYENFAQYRTLIWPGIKGWFGLTLPRETALSLSEFRWA
jgi:phosphopantetheinyl transferase